MILRDGSIIQQGTSQDILLNPADDYIQRFVRDVNRGRFLIVDAVMDAAGAATGGLPVLPTGTTLDAAVKQLADAGTEAAVVADAAGRPIGTVSQRRIMAAL